jgi:hypothetical protein
MESAQHQSGLPDHVLPRDNWWRSAHGGESRVQQELSEQFEFTLAFADFCTFLASNRVRQRAEQLTGLALALYEETTAELRRSGSRG